MIRVYSTIVGLAVILGSAGAQAGSCGSTLPSGRSLKAASDTFWLKAKNSADTCTISLGLKKVVVESERVLLGDKVIAHIDKSARSVTVTRKDGLLTIVADGRTVFSGSLK